MVKVILKKGERFKYLKPRLKEQAQYNVKLLERTSPVKVFFFRSKRLVIVVIIYLLFINVQLIKRFYIILYNFFSIQK
jgi:hypothetical protein